MPYPTRSLLFGALNPSCSPIVRGYRNLATVPSLPFVSALRGEDHHRSPPTLRRSESAIAIAGPMLRKYIRIIPPKAALSNHGGGLNASAPNSRPLGDTDTDCAANTESLSPAPDHLVLDLENLEICTQGQDLSSRGARIALFESIALRVLRSLHIRLAEGQPVNDLLVEAQVNPLSDDADGRGSQEKENQSHASFTVAASAGDREQRSPVPVESRASSGVAATATIPSDSTAYKDGSTSDHKSNGDEGPFPGLMQAELVFTVDHGHQQPPPEFHLSPDLGRASILLGLYDKSPVRNHVADAVGSSVPTGGSRMRFQQSPRMNAPHPAAGFLLDSKLADHCFLAPGTHLCEGGDAPDTSPNVSRTTGGAAVKRVCDRDPPPSPDIHRSPEGGQHEPTDQTNGCSDMPVPLESGDTYSSTIADDNMAASDTLQQNNDQGRGLQEANTPAPDLNEQEEEHVPMSYQIPPAMLRAAMTAAPSSAGSYYSQALYRGPNDRLLSIHYCTTMEIAERVAPYFLKERVLGFDIEWKPYGTSIQENASLIQLACEDRIALFHIALYDGATAEELLPPTLRKIIESPDIVKAGVAIKGDFKRLRDYLGVEAKGVFELSRLHNLVEHFNSDPKKSSSWRLYALAKQVHEHLQLPMYKGAVRESDWSKRLSYSQIQYAATDAYASLRIYDALEAKRKTLRPIPPRPELCDFDATIRPRSVPRAKAPSKAAEVLEETPSDQKAVAQVETEEESAYETAQEDLLDSQELERAGDSRSPSESGRLNVESKSDPKEEQHQDSRSIPRQIQRVGSVKLDSLLGSDPGYPVLPTLPDEDGSASDGTSGPVPMVETPTLPEGDNTDRYIEPKSRTGEQTGKVSPSHSPDQPGPIDASATSTQQSAPQPQPTSLPSKSPEYLLADSWAQAHLSDNIPPPSATASTSRIRASASHLRAYHLWHHQRLGLEAVARHLRDPPLAESTVASYILQAISYDRLEYRREDVKGVLRALPTPVRLARWRWFVEKVGGVY